MEKLREFLGVAALRGFEIENRTAGEKEAEHRTDAVEYEFLP